jgi:predicted enzyme related to lactoylglutathione lyase
VALTIVPTFGEHGEEEQNMISGGNATVFVSSMDRAVDFYTGVLGCKLTNRFGDNWATVEAGKD